MKQTKQFNLTKTSVTTNKKIAVIGLGYVGLSMAVEFGNIHPIIGFDIKPRRIDELRSGIDATLEVESSVLKTANIHYTASVDDLKSALNAAEVAALGHTVWRL